MAVEWKTIRFYKAEAESKKEDMPYSGLNVDMSILKAAKLKDDVRVDFRYTADFAPEVAKIILHGYVLIGGDKKELAGFVDAWEKKKSMPPDISAPLANLITYTSQLNGVLISKALSMPAPIIPPRLQR